jgi:hypothetical protein
MCGYHCEFALQDINDDGPEPVMRKGMTSIEARQYLRREFPDKKDWFFWNPARTPYLRYLQDLVERPDQRAGTAGAWTWKRIPCSYPEVFYWNNDPQDKIHANFWTGAVAVGGPAGENFILFSYLNSKGIVGEFFFVSTADLAAAHRFGQELEKHRRPKSPERIVIHTLNGPDVTVGLDDEPIYLAENIREDIESQYLSFFNNQALYQRLRVPYKRGFLFVGCPGTGKTMMIRNLVRKICVRHKDVQVSAINGWVDEEILGTFMAQAEASRPAILILEELDSLAAQHRLTRASLLTTLDGLQPHEGLMVLATTNNPGEVDPALLHRPSRFDRVWRFDLPDGNLRRRYLGDKFRECSGEVLDKLARRTEGWTFAYLNELRVTAGVIAIRDQDGQYTDAVLLQAHQLLEAQYEAGRRSHALPASHGQMGFRSE